jgi:hypothetical protein
MSEGDKPLPLSYTFVLCSRMGMSESSPIIPFLPVRLRRRRDGWPPAVQAAFLAALAQTRSVSEACRRVGRSRTSAYNLAGREDGASFRAAWGAVFSAPAPPRPRTPGAPRPKAAPKACQLPPPPPPSRPAYSLDAFRRAFLTSRRQDPSGCQLPDSNGSCQLRQLRQLPGAIPDDRSGPDEPPPGTPFAPERAESPSRELPNNQTIGGKLDQ